MSELEQAYDALTKKREKIIEELKELGKSKTVKRYLNLEVENEKLWNIQGKLYEKTKIEEYRSCEHILVYSEIKCFRYENRLYKSCGCIKCGLDNRVVKFDEWLSLDDEIMYNYLRKTCLTGTPKGIETKIACDLTLAHAIYLKIKEVYPDIDDETMAKFFARALNDIRNIKVNDDRKASRAKRLSLNPNFQRWNANDVYC